MYSLNFYAYADKLFAHHGQGDGPWLFFCYMYFYPPNLPTFGRHSVYAGHYHLFLFLLILCHELY